MLIRALFIFQSSVNVEFIFVYFGIFTKLFPHYTNVKGLVLLDFSLTVKAATLIFISGCGSAISSAKVGKSGFIYNLVKSY